LQKKKCVVASPKGLPASGHIYFVLAGAKQSSVTSAPDRLIVSMNLKRNFGNTEHSLHNVVHLEGVSALQVPLGEPTSANAAPTLKTFSIVLSIDSFISGE